MSRGYQESPGEIMTGKPILHVDKSNACRKCGQDIWELAERGAYLKRVSPVGEDFVGECAPSCQSIGNQDDALLRALK